MNLELLTKFEEYAERDKLASAPANFSNQHPRNLGPDSTADFESIRFLDSNEVVKVSTYTAFTNIPKHRHSFVEVMYMLRGSSTHVIDEKTTVTQNVNNLLFLSQGVDHKIINCEDNSLAIIFFLKPEFFDISSAFFDKQNTVVDFIMGAVCNSNTKLNYLMFDTKDILPIENLIENMIWAFLFYKQNSLQIIQNTMTLLLMHLNRFSQQCIFDSKADPNYNLAVQALEYINVNYVNGTLSDFSEKHKQSIYSANRIIKSYTGSSFKKIQKSVKMSHAIELLLKTNISVSDISSAIGYENKSYFYRAFKNDYDMTPDEYRRLHCSQDFPGKQKEEEF